MTRKQAKGRVYFHCSTYARKSKSACTIHSIRLDVLEQNVLNAVRDRLEQPDLPALSQELLASVIREILVHEDGTLSILFWEQESAVSHPVTQRPVRRAQPGQPAQPDPRGRRDRPALPDRKGRRDQPAPPAQPGQPDLPDRKARREYRGLPAPLAQPAQLDPLGLKDRRDPRERRDQPDRQAPPAQPDPPDRPDPKDRRDLKGRRGRPA